MSLVDIDLSFASQAKLVFNGLDDSMDPQSLSSDLVFVELPHRIRIDVSWLPEADPGGSYHVTLFQDAWDNKLGEFAVPTARDAARLVEELARPFSDGLHPVSCSSGTTRTVQFTPRQAA